MMRIQLPRPCVICRAQITEADFNDQNAIALLGPRTTVAHASHFFTNGEPNADYETNLTTLALAHAKAAGWLEPEFVPVGCPSVDELGLLCHGLDTGEQLFVIACSCGALETFTVTDFTEVYKEINRLGWGLIPTVHAERLHGVCPSCRVKARVDAAQGASA